MTEAIESYINACECAGIELCMPCASTKLDVPLYVSRIRSGENKYLERYLTDYILDSVSQLRFLCFVQ